MKQRIFVDMDGVLATFLPDASLEDLFTPGYFRYLPPMRNVVQAVNDLNRYPIFEVFILSHVLSEQAQADKDAWLDDYLPSMDKEHRIYVPYGTEKSLYIPGGIINTDVLIDDFTQNLQKWPAISIKLLNGINWSKKSWTGHVVSALADEKTIATALCAISKFEKDFLTR